jgi:hypothetical protein
MAPSLAESDSGLFTTERQRLRFAYPGSAARRLADHAP